MQTETPEQSKLDPVHQGWVVDEFVERYERGFRDGREVGDNDLMEAWSRGLRLGVVVMSVVVIFIVLLAPK